MWSLCREWKETQKDVDNAGIDPATYRMQSDRSTIWANYPRKPLSKWSLQWYYHMILTISSHTMVVCCKCFFDGAFQCSDSVKEHSLKPICIGCENTECVIVWYHLFCSVGTSILFCQMVNYLQRNPTHHICYIKPRYLFTIVVASRSVYHLKSVTFLEAQSEWNDLLKQIHVK